MDDATANLFSDLGAFYAKSLAAAEEIIVIMTLWTAHTHLIERFGTTLYLHFFSVEPECGKSRALELFYMTCRGPELIVDMSKAGLYRLAAGSTPTMLIDEVDNLLDNERGTLLGILHSGYRRGTTVVRMGGANNTTLERFDPFCPKAFSGLERLPHRALRSRTLSLELRRRLGSEPGGDFIFEDELPEGLVLKKRLEQWAESVGEAASGEKPPKPQGIGDRTWEGLRPLYIVASLAGPAWSARLLSAARILLAKTQDDRISWGTRLLIDCRTVFENHGTSELKKSVLLEGLKALPDAPYSAWDDFNTNKLTRTLKKYGVKSDRTIYTRGMNVRGWIRSDFEDAWARYCPPSPTKVGIRESVNEGDAVHGFTDSSLAGSPPVVPDVTPFLKNPPHREGMDQE